MHAMEGVNEYLIQFPDFFPFFLKGELIFRISAFSASCRRGSLEHEQVKLWSTLRSFQELRALVEGSARLINLI